MVRSWLFAPGHSERILARVFDAGADEALIDLEDAVPPDQKARARALEIASAPGVVNLAFGNVDFGLELNVDPSDDQATLYARSHLVVASRAAGIEPPSDGVWVRYRDLDGLRGAALRARRLGFFGKSAIHPSQVAIINEVFAPTPEELDWARRVVAAFEASGGAATRLDGGEMIDVPVAERARRLLALAHRS